METFLLKSSISLVILYPFYQVILRYETNHQLKRIIGMACLFFSIGFLLIPTESLFNSREYSSTIYTVVRESVDFQENLSSIITDSTVSIYFMIYIIGVGVFSLRSLLGLATLLLFYFKSQKYHRWGFKVVSVNKEISPFTFFNILFVGNHNLEDEDMNTLLVHEQVHRDQFHSIDSLILEVLTIIYWFNPIIWFFQKDIRAQHEYLADEQVIKKGVDILDYQHMLFHVRTGISIRLVNYFSSKTSLTKRFKMMTTTNKNTKISSYRALMFLPLMALILTISSFSEIYTSTQPDKLAVYEQGSPAMYKTIGKNIKYPQSARKINSQGVVYISFSVNNNGEVENVKPERRDGNLLETVVVIGYGAISENPEQITEVNETLKEEAVRVVESLGKFKPAQKDGKSVSSELTIPIEFKLRE